jgi:hypothetical protein
MSWYILCLNTMPWRRMVEWRYTTCVLHLDTRWRQVISFLPRPMYPWEKGASYPFDRRLDGPHSWSGCGAKEKKIPAIARKWTLVVQSMAVTILTKLPWLSSHPLKASVIIPIILQRWKQYWQCRYENPIAVQSTRCVCSKLQMNASHNYSYHCNDY